MTNKTDDQMIPSCGFFTASTDRRGCCSSDGGSGGSSCTENQEERKRNDTEEEEEEETRHYHDISDSEPEDDSMNTIKRNMKPVEPVRPPRVIDGQGRLEYYNLCHPPPTDPPAIPRRKPYISHLSHSQQSSTEPTTRTNSSCATTTTDTLSSMVNRNSNINKRKCQTRRKKGSVCSCKHSGSLERQDSVLLMYSRHCQGSIEWARYLHKLFTELSRNKSRLTVKHLPVEDLTCHLPSRLESEMFNARLQLVIVSPLFLQWVYSHPALLVGRLVQQDRVIALLLGVREEQVLPEHRSSLISFPQWVHLEARDHDLEFVQTVLYFSTQILQRTDSTRHPPTSESLAFTLFPRKITDNQNKVVVMLDKPLNARSSVRVVLEKSNGQRMALEDIKLKNPLTLLVTFPVCLFAKSSLVSLYLEVDGESKGFRQLKCESKTQELDCLLGSVCDPMEFLCQTLAISPQCKDQLDETLTQNLMSNIPKHGFPLLSFPVTRELGPRGREFGELPTLLHFSSAHGLERLTCALLDCPGARAALAIRNNNNATPSDIAKEHGFYDLAEILQAHQHNPTKFSHIYDYIKHSGTVNHDIRFKIPGIFSETRRPTSNISGVTDYSGPDPYNPLNVSNYQVPPPPRPVPSTPAKPNPYLDMSGSNSGTPSPCQARRQGRLGGHSINMRSQPRDLNDLFRSLNTQGLTNQSAANCKTSTLSKYNLDSTYQEIASPKDADPFGTMRASKIRRSFKEKTPTVGLGERLYVNDPFGTMRTTRANSVPKSFSSEASNDDVFAPAPSEETNRNDYRGVKSEDVNDNLAVTEELIELLEDFKNKSYSVKEMEILFENWRRKASLPENLMKEENSNQNNTDRKKNDLLKTAKSAYSLLKLFKGQTSESNPKIKRTTSTRKFLKANSIETGGEGVVASQQQPAVTEDKAVRTDATTRAKLDESEMSVVALPPTPLKADREDTSSQILPLHRLNSSSTLPRPSNTTSHTALAQQVLQRNKPVAEVSPFSNNRENILGGSQAEQLDDTEDGYQRVPNNTINQSMMEQSNLTPNIHTPNNTLVTSQERPNLVTWQTSEDRENNNDKTKSPVKDKLQKMRRSITEPLMQYFHDITLSSESEEPDILNTPKSLIQNSGESGKKLSRKLFSPKEETKTEETMTTLQRHPARTSQINEYQNISPTPSTDL